jgi:hypothetical protein
MYLILYSYCNCMIFFRWFYLYFFASKHLKANDFLQFCLDKKSNIEETIYSAAKDTGYFPECLWLVCIGLEVRTAPTGKNTN